MVLGKLPFSNPKHRIDNLFSRLKFGLNLLKLRESGTLRFFDGFQSVSEALDDQDNFNYLSKKLMSFLDENLDENSVIILDKVSILQSLGLDTKSAVELCLALQLKALTTKSVLVTRSRANSSLDVDLEDFSVDDPSDQISSFLAQSAFLNIVVRPLPTGKSLSVTGNLHFKSRAETAIHRFQYLLEEKDVKIFAKGTSNAVL